MFPMNIRTDVLSNGNGDSSHEKITLQYLSFPCSLEITVATGDPIFFSINIQLSVNYYSGKLPSPVDKNIVRGVFTWDTAHGRNRKRDITWLRFIKIANTTDARSASAQHQTEKGGSARTKRRKRG